MSMRTVSKSTLIVPYLEDFPRTWHQKLSKFLLLLLFAIGVCLLMSCQSNDQIEIDMTTSKPEPPIKSVSLTRDGHVFVLDKSGNLQRLANSVSSVQIATPVRDLDAVSFVSKDIGWVLARSGQLFSTNNGGSDWSLLQQLNVRFESSIAGQFEFVDTGYGWLNERFGVVKTIDGGVSWRETFRSTTYSTDEVVAQPTFTFPIDGSVAWVGLTGGGILKLNGPVVSYSDLELEHDDVSALFALDNRFCWAGTRNANGLYFTADGGDSWKEVLGEKNRDRFGISAVYFHDTEHGWVAGTKLETDARERVKVHALLMKTNDGGRNWQRIDGLFDADESPTIIRFFNKQKGWLVTNRSIFQSDDGGLSWVRILEKD